MAIAHAPIWAVFVNRHRYRWQIASKCKLISADIVSVVLSVEGTGLVPQSEIQWNKNSIADHVHRLRHLQEAVTQQTFDSFGGSAGKSVMISVVSPGANSVVGCPHVGNSSTVILEVD